MRLGKEMLYGRNKAGVLFVAIALVACTFSGCDKHEKGTKDSGDSGGAALVAPSSDGAGAETDADAEKESGQVLVEVESWPGRQDMSTFSLTWLGGDESAILRAFPKADSAEVARRSWEDGSEVEWRDSRVVVYAGRPFRATKDTRLEAMEYVSGEEQREPEEMIDEEIPEIEIKQGDLIELYQYVGDETCYLGFQEKVYVGDCPGEDFQVEGNDSEPGQKRLEPLEQEWWVLVGDGAEAGWVQLEGSLFEARMRRMTEYE